MLSNKDRGTSVGFSGSGDLSGTGKVDPSTPSLLQPLGFTNSNSVETAKQKGCNMCGGQLVEIRGKYPNQPKRLICPTCTYERLEQINELSNPDYGKTYKNIKHK